MPTTRRKQAATATGSTRSQSTLSFNNKTARVTKPSVHDTSAANKKAQAKLSEPEQTEVIEEASIQTPEPEIIPSQEPVDEEASLAIDTPKPTPRKRRASKTSTPNPREAAASKISDSQVKKYWKAEEDVRLAPRVHQSQLPLHEKILRHFDLSSQYGPCIGISRLSRWKRANTLGLEPPVEVLAVLLREEDKKTSQGCGRLAYIDELGGGKVGIVE